MRLTAIYLSSGHNYFGHHGGPAGRHRTVAVSEVECVEGRGLRGDRFFDHKPDYKGQVTFFAGEVYEGICLALGIHDKSPAVFRRNIITRDADLNALTGRVFEVQGVRFFGASECSPCTWMDQAFGPGAENFLRGSGGLRARILNTGILRASAA